MKTNWKIEATSNEENPQKLRPTKNQDKVTNENDIVKFWQKILEKI